MTLNFHFGQYKMQTGPRMQTKVQNRLGPGLDLGLSLHFRLSLQSAFYTDRFPFFFYTESIYIQKLLFIRQEVWK